MTVSDLILERAAELWVRALIAPKFDNGANNTASLMAGVLTDQMAAKIVADADYPAALERFRVALVADLKRQRDHAGEPDPGREGSVIYLTQSLGTDYGPDRTLAAAAEIAGLPTTVFPWKSLVSFYGGESVCAEFGYRGAPAYHHPISGGRWAITSCALFGPDRAIILAAVENGTLALKVETPGAEAQP